MRFIVKHFNFFQVNNLFIIVNLFIYYFIIIAIAILPFDINLFAILNFFEIILDFKSLVLKF